MQEKRLQGNTIITMVLLAVCIDVAQVFLDFILIGLVVNRLIDLAVGGLFYFWFKAHKVDFKKTRAVIFFGLALLEMLPGVDAFPLWIIDIVAVIISVNMEDRLGLSTSSIINNPRTQRILKKGIIKSVNVVANRSTVLRRRLNKTGFPQNTTNISQAGTNRNLESNPNNSNRDARIEAQRANKSNANQ